MPARRVVAIHQPNFFPWLGYFDKLRRSDVFIFLDAVDYPKSGSGMGSITNRVRININGEARWIGCPVVREHGPQPILKVRIDERTPWRDKVLRSIELSYKKAPNYGQVMPLLKTLLAFESHLLADFNINAIRNICEWLGLRTHLVRQSDVHVEGKATQLLIGLVKSQHGTVYMCGAGASEYQRDELFPQQGVELLYQTYEPKPYGDPACFIPGLSVIDYLMRTPVASWTEGF